MSKDKQFIATHSRMPPVDQVNPVPNEAIYCFKRLLAFIQVPCFRFLDPSAEFVWIENASTL